jgi:hypothetical protein
MRDAVPAERVEGWLLGHEPWRWRYAIDVTVNSYTSQGTALEYAYRRAGELCPDGYDTIDGSKSQSDFYVRNGNTVQNLSKGDVALIIECRSAEPPEPMPAVVAAPPPPPQRRVIEGDHEMFCTSVSTNADIGSCWPDESRCAEFREDNNKRADRTVELVECVKTPAVACFNFTRVLAEQRDVACAPSIKSCEDLLLQFKANPDYRVTAVQCGIYRTKRQSPSGEQ